MLKMGSLIIHNLGTPEAFIVQLDLVLNFLS